MKSKLREIISLIQHGPEDPDRCLVYYYDRVQDQVCSLSFNEFMSLQIELGVPNHRIRAILSTGEGKPRILFQRPDFDLSELNRHNRI